MKFSLLLLLVCSVTALVPSDRRAFIAKAPAVTAAALSICTLPSAPAFAGAADEYSTDVKKSTVATPKKKGNGGAAVGGVLFGGFALSLPFFLPNLLRLAGKNNVKNPGDN